MSENNYEKLFNINTCGTESLDKATFHYNRYEATPYFALEELFSEFTITSKDTIVDFGCGKGRLAFYANYYFDAKVTGVEMNPSLIDICNKNKVSYISQQRKAKSEINFYNCFAQEYEIKDSDNIFYFFNPFSLPIFTKVLDNILLSYDKYPRNINIILYYPSDDYIYYLDNNTILSLEKVIKIRSLFHKNPREVALIYSLQ